MATVQLFAAGNANCVVGNTPSGTTYVITPGSTIAADARDVLLLRKSYGCIASPPALPLGAPRFKVAGLPSLSPVAGTPLKLTFNSVVFDPNGYWDPVNFRWVPQVAGTYLIQLNANFVSASSTVFGQVSSQIRQNGNNAGAAFEQANLSTQALSTSVLVDTMLVFNGSTDYLEGFGFFLAATSGSWTTPSFSTGANNNFMSAVYLGP